MRGEIGHYTENDKFPRRKDLMEKKKSDILSEIEQFWDF
jgi:hypothetical protein